MPATFADFLTISAAISRLEDGMWGGVLCPIPVLEAKRKMPRARIGFGPWRVSAAQTIREAALAGKLSVYVRCMASASAIDLLGVPTSVLRRMIVVRDGLPDRVIRPTQRLVEGASDPELLLKALSKEALLIREGEFAAWYRAERRRRLWPSQKTSKKKHPGRPSRMSEELRNGILARVNEGTWTAQMPISELRAALVSRGYPDLPSDETIARCIDALHLETGELRLRRTPKRRVPSNKRSSTSSAGNARS